MFHELQITSWNCGGFSYNFYMQDVELIKKLSSDIICIQETHLTDCQNHKECLENGTSCVIEDRSQLYECFLKLGGISKNYDYSAISYTEQDRNDYRWKGQQYGLAILWKKNLKELKGYTCTELLEYNGKRYWGERPTHDFHAVQVTNDEGTLNILIINLYILNKEKNKARVLLDLISELCVDWENVVVCGDFNFKPWDSNSERLKFEKFRGDLYDRGLNVVDVDKLGKNTVTYKTADGTGSSWPDHFIASPFIADNCELNLDATKHNGVAHYPFTLTFSPYLTGNRTKGCRTAKTRASEMYKWDVPFLELLFLEMHPSGPPDLPQKLFEKTMVFKFQPSQEEDMTKKLKYSRTYFRSYFDVLCFKKCVMNMDMLPAGDKLILELELTDKSSVLNLFTVSCRFEIQCKFREGPTEKAILSSPTQIVEKRRSRWEVRLSHFFKNSADCYKKDNQLELLVEVTTKYCPKFGADKKYWQIDRIVPVFAPSEGQETWIKSRTDPTICTPISEAVLKGREITLDKSEIVVEIEDTSTLLALKQYLEKGTFPAAVDHPHCDLCVLAKTAKKWGLRKLASFCLLRIAFMSLQGTVNKGNGQLASAIDIMEKMAADPEYLEVTYFLYNKALPKFAALELETKEN